MIARFRCTCVALAVGTLLSLAAHAHDPSKHATPALVQDIAPAAADAVKVVDAFHAALKAAKLADAEKLLDPSVLILESGGAERNREQYMQGHAGADAQFLSQAQQRLTYRRAQAEGNLAWVGSESTLQRTKDGKRLNLAETETMLLKKSTQGWKIVHIHWSSRPMPADNP